MPPAWVGHTESMRLPMSHLDIACLVPDCSRGHCSPVCTCKAAVSWLHHHVMQFHLCLPELLPSGVSNTSAAGSIIAAQLLSAICCCCPGCSIRWCHTLLQLYGCTSMCFKSVAPACSLSRASSGPGGTHSFDVTHLMSTHLLLLSLLHCLLGATLCCILTALTAPPAISWLLLLYILQICGRSVMPEGSSQWSWEEHTASPPPIAVGHLLHHPMLQV